MSRENLPPSGTRPRGAPAGGVSISTSLSVIVAAIAVLLGFLILRDVNRNNDTGNFDGITEVPTDGSDATGESTTVPPPLTAVDRSSFKILVANASGVQGAAADMTTKLQSNQFVVTEPRNKVETLGDQATTIVYYVPGFETQAALVADILGGVQILPVASPPPVEGESLGEAVVLVLLGTDLANMPLPGALPVATPTTTTTLPAG